jgi:hypothetical protein
MVFIMGSNYVLHRISSSLRQEGQFASEPFSGFPSLAPANFCKFFSPENLWSAKLGITVRERNSTIDYLPPDFGAMTLQERASDEFAGAPPGSRAAKQPKNFPLSLLGAFSHD